MRKHHMNDCSQILHQQLFLLDRHLKVSLFKIRHHCLTISKIKFYDFNFTEPKTFEEFRLF